MIESFLGRLRRRLRLVWAWATTAWVAPVVATVVVATVAVGWLLPWGWPEPAAFGVLGVVLSLVGVGAAVQRLPSAAVARAADRGLATGDSFAAALQFRGSGGPFAEAIEQRAEAVATGADPAQAAPFRSYQRRWLLSGALLTLALGLAVAPNPQDQVRADRAATNELLEATADRLDEEAEALAESPENEPIVDQVTTLAQELRQADDLAAAQQLLDDAQRTLASARPDNFASQRAATEGLDRSLADRPLSGPAGQQAKPAAQQLADTADDLGQLSPEDQAALDKLAERLGDLAATQSAGNPAVADALAEAAAALGAGDVAGAQAALGEAALAQGAAAGAVAAQLGANQAAGALANAQAALGKAAAGQGQGAGQDQGQGAGPGQGAGQGQGQGAGQGQGGGGGAQGQVSGAAGGTGSGRGGAGTSRGGDQARIDSNDGATIIDPLSLTPGDETSLGGVPGGASAEVIGQGDGPTTAGLARVPLAEIVGQYADRATTAADQQRLAPSQRRLVGDYFDLLSQ